MREYHETLGGREWHGYALERPEDIDTLWTWLKTNQPRSLAYDTETTGLKTYSGDHVRTAQFGTADTGFIIPVERGPQFVEVTTDILRKVPEIVIHNSIFDMLMTDEHLGVKVEEIEEKVRDTKILAHLYDSRKDFEGGMGHSLKPLSAHLVDPSAPDTQDGLVKEFKALKLGHTKANPVGWRSIPYENETYQRYGILDTVLLARVRVELEKLLQEASIPASLVESEHHLVAIMTRMRRKGMLLDVPYTEGLVGRLTEEQEHYSTIAKRYGVSSVHAPKQVVAALQGMGEEWDEKTDSGEPAAGKEVLLPMAGLNDKWEEIGRPDGKPNNPLALAVLHAKRAGKWRKSYAEAMLANRDSSDRIHPDFNTLGAKTGRTSVSDPPLQQLPSRLEGWKIRRSIIAPEGESYFSVDQSSVELVVMAALSQDPNMVAAVQSGRNLHDYTASLMYGPDFTKDQRGKAKIGGLGVSYQGGPDTLSKMTGLPVPEMKDVMARYLRAYPTLKPWFRWLQREARAKGCEVRTPSGRLLRLDRDKLYKVVAYLCQSTARDTMCQALLNMDAQGLTQYLTMWIHDEVIGTAPKSEAPEIARAVQGCMEMTLFGVPIKAGEANPADMVYGRSWGHGYGLPAEFDIQ